MIEVKNLTKTYGNHDALRGVSFKIANGKIYGLLGPNGAGKSTTMNIMTGCLAPTAGTVRINGFDIYEEAVEAKRLIGYLPEQPPLYDDMTPEEFLLFVAEAKGVHPDLAYRQVKEVMALTDITDMKDRLIRNLSKGCRQRVGIAQAMLGSPEVIILDEPTVGLDPKQLVEIREIIRSLGEDRTVIVSSHILSEVSELCDELLVISQGTLVAQGTLEELEGMVGQTDTLHLNVRGDEAGVMEVLRGIVDVENVKVCVSQDTVSITLDIPRGRDVRDDIFFAMADKRYAVVAMDIEHKSLENVFLALTQTNADDEDEDYDDEDYDDEAEEEEAYE